MFRKGKGNYRFRRFVNGKDKEFNTGTIDKKEAEKFLVEYLSGERLAEEQVRKKKNPAKIATLVMEAIDSDYEQLPLEDVFELWYIHSPNFSTTSKAHQQKRKVWFAKFVKFCFSQGITYFDEVNESIAIRFKFRLFRGTLKYSTFMATLEIVDALVHWAAQLSISDILSTGDAFENFTGYILSNPLYANAVNYLRENNLMEVKKCA
ncbi:MAG TPA: hypothetical protein DD673_14755 [Lentisphaeria bacterium]|nr:hypothetical protein [Lentisphaeria bacterium]